MVVNYFLQASFRGTKDKHDKDRKKQGKSQLGELEEERELGPSSQQQPQYKVSEMSEAELDKLMEQMLVCIFLMYWWFVLA